MKATIDFNQEQASENISNILARQRQKERELNFSILESDIKPRLTLIINKEDYT